MRPEKSHEPPSAGWKAGKLGRQFSLSLRPENRGTNAINARLRAGEDESRRSENIFIHLPVPAFSCCTQDLQSLLWHERSLVAARGI